MKKYFGIAFISFFISALSVTAVAAGYRFGPGNIFYMEASAGFNVGGLWVQGKMSNAELDGALYSKRVYARSGATGSYSSWLGPSIDSVTHRDYGAFDDDYAEVSGQWK